VHTVAAPSQAAPSRSTRERVLAGVIFGAVTIAVAVLGSVVNQAHMEWYDGLDKPGFTPPGVTFGVVWTVLYVLIAIAGWLTWRVSADPRPTVAWGAQMALNLVWTLVFFGLEAPEAGLVVIALLIAAVAVNLALSVRVESSAGVLLFPYLVWCGFAAALNVGVAVLN
jgi:benzodiazapine receptor